MSCILQAFGDDFDVDSFIASVPLQIDSFWRKGEKRFPQSATSKINETSGVRVVASEADISQLAEQIEDVTTFLRNNLEQVKLLASFPGVKTAALDFGAEVYPTTNLASFTFPSALLALAGEAGVSLCLSVYPIDEEENIDGMFTKDDFEKISWHDNAIHGFHILEGEPSGELVLDIDFITEWLAPVQGAYSFQIAPSDLIFHEVSDLVISVNYAAAIAVVQPMIIRAIHREAVTYPNGYSSFTWKIELNWPPNSFFTFQASGFTQMQRMEPIHSGGQYLSPPERKCRITHP
jgi:hypothetical protein